MLREAGARFEVIENPHELLDQTAELLASEKVVGWCHGRMEFGPRALGTRSILGDPRSEKMQKIMNLKIKCRESFRLVHCLIFRSGQSRFMARLDLR